MFLHRISVQNLLSFGPDAVEIELKPLNVIIGPNGSGKSNLIEIISLLQAAPQDLSRPVRDAGGIKEWFSKTVGKGKWAFIEIVVEEFHRWNSIPLQHEIALREHEKYFEIVNEVVAATEPEPGAEEPHISYSFLDGRAKIFSESIGMRDLSLDSIRPEQSILSQKKDNDFYPVLTRLGEEYSKIILYREWSIGRFTAPRQFQDAAARQGFLEEDFSNLGLVLNTLRRNAQAKRKILKYLQIFNADIVDYDVDVKGGRVQVFLQEGDTFIPATRLSDGTLRFLCLLTILCHPEPPPLICIEEPELGMHPDIIPTVAELLKDASERTQLIVTTHSDILIDEFTETPEDIIVCEKHDMQTSMRRLTKDDLASWIKEYRLGSAWLKGKVGGTRW